MAAIRASAQTKNVYELFAGKVFRVPQYQRNYAWTDTNWKDFWEDIKEGLSTGTEHYWGTITLRATGESLYSEERDIPLSVYEVVDGQQRITALYLFLLALSRAGKPAIKENFVKRGDVYSLELGGLNNQFLKDIVDDKSPKPNITTNRLLKHTLEYFGSQMQAFGDFDALSKYLQSITFLLEFVVQDEKLAVRAFESLNDRGKQLTLLDKTKSFLMFYSLRYLDNSLSELINGVFGKVFTDYDLIKESGTTEDIDYIRSQRFSEEELLRFFYHYFARYATRRYLLGIAYDYDVTQYGILELFLKTACSRLKDNPDRLAKFLEELLKNFERFVSGFRNVVEKVATEHAYKKLFSFLGLNARVYPLILSLEAENLLDQKMLDIIESLDLRVYKIRGTDPRADLYRNTISQIKMSPSAPQIVDSIRSFVGEFMWDAEFRYNLSQRIYSTPAEKYILWELEKYKDPSFNECDYNLYNDVQVEHVFPVMTTLSFPAYEFKDEHEYLSGVYRLGNLCLLEAQINKRVGNSIPPEKAKHYRESKIPGTRNLGYYIQAKDFTKSDIEKRTQEITELCINRWKR